MVSPSLSDLSLFIALTLLLLPYWSIFHCLLFSFVHIFLNLCQLDSTWLDKYLNEMDMNMDKIWVDPDEWKDFSGHTGLIWLKWADLAMEILTYSDTDKPNAKCYSISMFFQFIRTELKHLHKSLLTAASVFSSTREHRRMDGWWKDKCVCASTELLIIWMWHINEQTDLEFMSCTQINEPFDISVLLLSL